MWRAALLLWSYYFWPSLYFTEEKKKRKNCSFGAAEDETFSIAYFLSRIWKLQRSVRPNQTEAFTNSRDLNWNHSFVELTPFVPFCILKRMKLTQNHSSVTDDGGLVTLMKRCLYSLSKICMCKVVHAERGPDCLPKFRAIVRKKDPCCLWCFNPGNQYLHFKLGLEIKEGLKRETFL